ncbi:signal peptidase I [Actinomyces sp. zg-332]|uniref:signal peptidase I n=1 Tax=Actinomyces sp. zg-332 TaxID=2708340 RepID=UPI0014219BD9|nr:signal peptidase I [Actinomyces sp. zg-332]QPK93762.1 signal peptidase I [Actinomyces sp. zg-332]
MGKNKKKKSSILELLFYVVLAIIISVLIRAFVFQPFYIPSGSMENTLKINDTIAVNKLSTRFSNINRGDIVVFKDPGNWVSSAHAGASSNGWFESILYKVNLGYAPNDVFLIKRAIAIGGDTVECKGKGHPILVNGVPIKEEYLKESVASSTSFKVKVPKNRIWVMGDNRNNSGDSRYHQDNGYSGTVSVDNIVGKAFAVMWPISRMQILYGTDAFNKVS